MGLIERGNYEICRICFWEDDPFQFADPTSGDGANPPSLVEAQRSYAEHGVSELRFASNVRKVRWTDRKDRAWRPFEDGDHVSTGTLAEFDGVPYWMRNR